MIERADFRKSCCCVQLGKPRAKLKYCLGRGELGNGLGSLGNGMLGKLTRKHETNSRLDLARAQGGLLVVGGELSGLA